jgi:molybdenum cofactor cytidylyltransferase
MVWHPVRAALEAGLDPVVVVTAGPGTGSHEAVSELEQGAGLPIRDGALRRVVNPHPERGLASTLTIGVSALGPETAAALILLGDMPWVRPETIRSLVAAFRQHPAAPTVPIYRRSRGNPVLWPVGFFEALTRLTGDRGARGLLTAAGSLVQEVPVDDPGVLRDVDTAAELAELD